jgi:hypothetical protein
LEKGPTSSIRYDVGGSSSHQLRFQPQTDGIPKRASRKPPERVTSAPHSSVGKMPASIVGIPAERASRALPNLPDQERSVTLWLLAMAWIGSYPNLTPSQRVESVVSLVTNVRHSGWVPGDVTVKLNCEAVPRPSLVVISQLMYEYGVLQVSHALLGCVCFSILVNHSYCDARTLLAQVIEASDTFERWATSVTGWDSFGELMATWVSNGSF